jgi:hypothetical protein
MEAPGRIPVWCTPLRFSAPTAAMINGTAVHGFELDDVGPGGHNGSVTLSSALAAGQHRGGISGKDHPIPREDVLEKFRKMTARRLTPDAQDKIVSLCDRLETLTDATALLAPIPDRAP